MSGESFNWTPKNPVRPYTPEFNIVETESKSLKRNIQLIDSSRINRYELDFGDIRYSGEGIENSRFNLRNHYINQNHNYTSFSWTSVPSYISDSALTVRYDDYQEEPVSNINGLAWNVKIVFREEPS